MKKFHIVLRALPMVTSAFVLLAITASAQNPAGSISPSPNSASFAKAVESPVDVSTGIPQVGFPLLQIRSRKLSYPISLSYLSGGIKVDEVASWVGLGFNLNAGGVITRVMRSRPDEEPVNGFLANAASIPNSTDAISLATLGAVAAHQKDMMPDLFYYNAGTIGGKIMFDNQGIPRTIPRADIRVSITNSDMVNLNSVFNLTTSDGTTYEFQAGETFGANLGVSVSYTATWYLSKILSADRMDTIRFTYVNGVVGNYFQQGNKLLECFYDAPAGSSKLAGDIYQENNGTSVTATGTRYLSRIDFNGGKVEFSVSGSRSDDPYGQRLNALIIYSRDPVSGSYAETKRIVFNYDYFNNSDTGTRLRLLSFQERSPLSHYSPPCQFIYSSKALPAPGSTAQDHWGYYNGATANTSLIPAKTVTSGGVDYVLSTNNREVDSTVVGGFILSQIISPLGGSTLFVFEGNQYLDPVTGLNTAGPGLRIKKIIERDPFTPIRAVTNYEYKRSDGKSSGILVNTPSYFTNMDVVDIAHTVYYYYHCELITVNPTSLGTFEGPPVIYEYATTYRGDDVNVAGKTFQTFSKYTNPTVNYPYVPLPDRSWQAGNRLVQEDYKVVAGTPTIVRKIENTFIPADSLPTNTTIKGLVVDFNKILIHVTPAIADYMPVNYFDYSQFQYLSKTKATDYEQGSGSISLVTNTNNYYEQTAKHLLMTRTKTETSDSNVKLQQQFKYPLDFPASGVFLTMQNLGMNSYPVEVTNTEIKGSSTYVTDFSKTDFFEWFPGRVYPITTYRSALAAPVLRSTFDASPSTYYRAAMSFIKYDVQGFLQESQQAGDVSQSMMIDGKLAIQSAAVAGSRADNIAFNSFESLDPGQWTIAAGTQVLTHPFTVSDAYPISSFTLAASTSVPYTYTVVRTSGPHPVLTFSKVATTPVTQTLTLTSGSGSVTLAAGTWTASLSWPANVTSITVNCSFTYTYLTPPNIVTTAYKTGSHSILFTSTQTISKTSLTAGDYWLTYYQKGGTLTVTPTGGASVLTTANGTADANGWTLFRKKIRIVNTTDVINLTSSSCYVDELRLYPALALMKTTSLDAQGRPSTVSDANLVSKFYEYDEWGRIKLVRDKDLNIVAQYKYQNTGN